MEKEICNVICIEKEQARGYYVSTVGNITEDAIKRYIQEQKEEDERKEKERN